MGEMEFWLREAAKEALTRYKAKRDMQAAAVLVLYEISQNMKRLEEKTDTGFKSQCADFQAYSNMLAGKIDVLVEIFQRLTQEQKRYMVCFASKALFCVR